MTSDSGSIGARFLSSSIVLGGVFCISVLQVAQGQGIAGAEGSRAALFQFQPQTAQQLLSAAQIAWKLDRTADARGYLRQLADRDPQSSELLMLRKQQGLAIFVDLQRDQRLHPESPQLLKTMQQAISQPEIAALGQRVSDLGVGGAGAADAVTELLIAGDAAVPALLAADAGSPTGRVAQAFLEVHAVDFRGGLLQQLPQADVAVAVRILKLLSGTAREELALPLIKWQFHQDAGVSQAAIEAVGRLSKGRIRTPTTQDAAELLAGEAGAVLRQAALFSLAMAEGGSDSEADSAALLKRAEYLLADAISLQPQSVRARELQQVLVAAGADPVVSAPAGPLAGRPASEVLPILGTALDLQQWPAAIECLRNLSTQELSAADQTAAASVLSAAVVSADVRVRVLAAVTARRNQLAAGTAVFGANQVLAAAAGSAAQPEAVVIAPDDQLSLVLRQLLEDQKYVVKVAETGPSGFEQSVDSLHCEAIFLSLYPSRWSAATTLANLRADCRTRSCPVVLIGRPDQQVQARALQEIHGNVHFMSEPIGVLSFPSQLRGLNLRLLLTVEERQFLSTLATPPQSATSPQQ
jgi:CheY-like chemotaxis protein